MHAYMEEFDLGLRLLAAGWRAVAAPDAVGVHLGSATHGHRSRGSATTAASAAATCSRRYVVLRGRQRLVPCSQRRSSIAGDLLISRDLAAARGRVSGWRAAAPAAATVASAGGGDRQPGIGFRRSLGLRLGDPPPARRELASPPSKPRRRSVRFARPPSATRLIRPRPAARHWRAPRGRTLSCVRRRHYLSAGEPRTARGLLPEQYGPSANAWAPSSV